MTWQCFPLCGKYTPPSMLPICVNFPSAETLCQHHYLMEANYRLFFSLCLITAWQLFHWQRLPERTIATTRAGCLVLHKVMTTNSSSPALHADAALPNNSSCNALTPYSHFSAHSSAGMDTSLPLETLLTLLDQASQWALSWHCMFYCLQSCLRA